MTRGAKIDDAIIAANNRCANKVPNNLSARVP